MQRKLTGRTVALIFIVVWALYSMFPMRSGDLMEAFKDRAENKDAAFEEIAKTAQEKITNDGMLISAYVPGLPVFRI